MSDHPKGSLTVPWLCPDLTQEGGCRTVTFVDHPQKETWDALPLVEGAASRFW